MWEAYFRSKKTKEFFGKRPYFRAKNSPNLACFNQNLQVKWYYALLVVEKVVISNQNWQQFRMSQNFKQLTRQKLEDGKAQHT